MKREHTRKSRTWLRPFALVVVVPLALLTALARAAGPEVTVTVTPEYEAAHPGTTTWFALTFQIEEGWHVNSHTPLDEFLIPTEVRLGEGTDLRLERVIYPTHKTVRLKFSDSPVAVYEDRFIIAVALAIPDTMPVGSHKVPLRLRYQACNDTQCAPPKNLDFDVSLNVVDKNTPVKSTDAEIFKTLNREETTPGRDGSVMPQAEAQKTDNQDGRTAETPWEDSAKSFHIAGRLDGYANATDFLKFLDDVEAGRGTGGNPLRGRQWYLILISIFLGGLLLNLTPCVLPLIPINLAIIGAGTRAGSKLRGFLLGGAYGAGIALVYGILGVMVVLGLSTAFGTINSTVWFNAGIAVLFIVLALAMFDIIEIDFSRYQARLGVRKGGGGSFLVALFMGGISALLAGACVAPMVIYTLVYAQDLYANGQRGAIFLPFVLGAGMALPWPIAGAGLSVLPRPGAWMVRVKQAMGVFILLFALYYGHLAYSIFRASGTPSTSGEHDASARWTTSLAEGLARGQKENKPVLVDFWATWCKNCFVMEKTVFTDSRVVERLTRDYVWVKYQAEDPDDPQTAAVMKEYRVQGLPTFIVLKPNTAKTSTP